MKSFDTTKKIKLSPDEKNFVKSKGLTLSPIAMKYHNAKNRAAIRGSFILPQYQFYRVLLNKVITVSQETGKSPQEILEEYHIHSHNFRDYDENLQLLTAEEHFALHSKVRQEEAKKVIAKGFTKCPMCEKVLPLTNFPAASNTYTGYVLSRCKECYAAYRKKYYYPSGRAA